MGWIGEAKQKNCAQEKNLVERPTALHLSKPSDNVTNAENIFNISAEKHQTSLILSPRKLTAIRRKSTGVEGFMEEMHKANSS
jgi:hypothetical protein